MILAIYGTGGSGRESQEIANSINMLQHRWDSILFVDDYDFDRTLHGSDVVSFDQLCSAYSNDDVEFIIAVGEPSSRQLLCEKVQAKGFELATIVHPSAFVSPSARIGRGVLIKMQTIVSSDAVVGDNSFIQANVIVGHDVRVGAHSQISAYSHIAGGAILGSRTYLGVRSSIRECCVLGDDVLVAMGAVVMEKKVPSNVLALGNPAKYVRRKPGSKVFS